MNDAPRYKRCSLFILLALLAAGCGKSEQSPPVSTQPAMHEHHAPHGGCLIELGEEFAHLELLLDSATGQMTIYSLDGEAEKFVRLKQPTLELLVTDAQAKDNSATISQGLKIKLDAQASSLSGETVGDSSQFTGQSDQLKGVDRFNGQVASVDTRGQRFESVPVHYPQGNEEEKHP